MVNLTLMFIISTFLISCSLNNNISNMEQANLSQNKKRTPTANSICPEKTYKNLECIETRSSENGRVVNILDSFQINKNSEGDCIVRTIRNNEEGIFNVQNKETVEINISNTYQHSPDSDDSSFFTTKIKFLDSNTIEIVQDYKGVKAFEKYEFKVDGYISLGESLELSGKCNGEELCSAKDITKVSVNTACTQKVF